MRFSRLLVALATLAIVGTVGACGSSSPSGGKLTIAAVQGVEDAGLKALAPMYKEQKGVDIEITEAPYADLYTKLVNTFKPNDATYDLIMMHDPWMPKSGEHDDQMAPMLVVASIATTVSRILGMKPATRSPVVTPSERSAAASWVSTQARRAITVPSTTASTMKKFSASSSAECRSSRSRTSRRTIPARRSPDSESCLMCALFEKTTAVSPAAQKAARITLKPVIARSGQ